MRRFDAPWDRALVTSTIALLAVTLITAVAGVSAALQAGMRGFALGVAVIAGGVAVGGWALAPRGFALGDGRLLVLRNGWLPHRIPLAEVRSVARCGPELLAGAIRILGTGGLFGYYGLFRSAALGSFHLHATRSEELVLVRTPTRTYVLTPEPARDFEEALLAAAPSARRERPPRPGP